MKFVPPALATRVAEVPVGDDWSHEPKLDGYRMQCHVEGTRARLYSRNGLDWSDRFPTVTRDVIALLDGTRAILDGEVVMTARAGLSAFQALQSALNRGDATDAIFYIFDLLTLDGRDLRPSPLRERRAALRQLLGQRRGGRIRIVSPLRGDGAFLLAAACARGDEGIISKRSGSRYPVGRSREWLKIKCGERDELIIIGFSPPQGSREHFGALLLATRMEHDGALRYAGRVGSGFSSATLKSLRARLKRIERNTPPCPVPRDAMRGARWVKPQLVAQVSFTEWTSDRLLRQATFLGLREDKEAGDVTQETPPDSGEQVDSTVEGVAISHPARVVFAAAGITKHEIAAYYEAAAPLILAHIAERPLSTLRCPNGVPGQCFFQKHWKETRSSAIRTMTVRESDGSTDQYAVATTASDLIRLVQMNVIELHPWPARRKALESPDRLILDLDPGPGVAWEDVVAAAHQVRALLDAVQLQSWVKLSGGKGVHITVPFERRITWEQLSGLARLLAARLVADHPDTFVDKASKTVRRRRIFVDWLRNTRGATAIAPWSVRARDSASVAAPLAWEELSSVDGADVFTVTVAMSYFSLSPDDAWAGMLTSKQRITPATVAALG